MEVIIPQPQQMVASNVPAFLAKLWKMVDDPETNHLIAWGDEGNSFVIHNHGDFEQTLLPYYYKHSNMASFVRQLNMYGFHKKVGIDSGGLKSEHVEEQEFYHTYFLRGQEHLLENIKRKVASNKGPGVMAVGSTNFVPATYNADKINTVLNEVTQLKDKQEDMDGKLGTMKKENEALWREVVSLRQKHLSQQKIVNKLIQFLVSLVSQPRRGPSGLTTGGGVKRQFNQPLAIEGATHAKQPKFHQSSDIHQSAQYIGAGTTGGQATTIRGDSGPIIREVFPNEGEEDLSGQFTTQPISVVTPMSPFSEAVAAAVNPYMVDNSAPNKTTANSASTVTLHAAPGTTDSQQAILHQPTFGSGSGQKRPALHREMSREDMDLEVNTVQKDLDHLKDMLSGQITLDSSLITNLFNPDESLATLFAGQDLNLGAIGSPPSGTSGNLPPLEMEVPTSKSELSGIISPGAVPTQQQQAAIGQYLQQHEELEEDQPTLFELADIDELDVVGTESGSSKGEKQKANRSMKIPIVPSDDLSLNTPLISSLGDYQDNPLLKSINKGKKK